MKRPRKVRHQYTQKDSWIFVNDNARSHTVPGKKGGRSIGTSSISPDHNPPDFFLFLRLKFTLKRKRFDDIPDIQRNVTRLLNSIPKEDLLQSFQDMYSRSQGCIV
ncbi:hypothetical protein TNCV_946411 [Trichonephila clavipes]|nr:hypothetical protein TNCV_946411 [Trichonephila clavipes]